MRAVTAVALVLAVIATIGLGATATAAASAVPVVVGGARPSMPSISGSQVVWADKYDGNWDLFRYDGITGTTSRLTQDAADQSMPAVDGGRVAYVDYSTGNGDIVVRDLVTGLSTRIALDGDQTHPTLSGDWLAWEDHSTRSTRISVRNLVSGATYALGADGSPAERPAIAGDLLVWEDHRAQSSGRLDPDVWVLRLSDGTQKAVSATDVTEYYPVTNGRYIAWSQRTSDGYVVRAYDMVSGEYTDLSTGPGEQTTPSMTDSKVYWTDNTPGQPLHVDTYDLASGQRAPFYSYSAGDIVGLTASGGNATWLESAGGRVRVRVLLNDGLSPLARLAALSPLQSAVSSVRLALISTGGDSVAPEVTSTSVARGATRVSRTAPLAVYFSEPIDPASVSAETVRVIDSDTGEPVEATVRYSALTDAVTVKPDTALDSGTFTLEIDPSITDAAGNALAAPIDISFSTASAGADVAKPTKPGLTDVRTSGASNVQLTWTPSVDDVAVSYYDIYRRSTPMSSTDYAGRELVSTVPSTTLTTVVSSKADEKSKSFTYYYVVVARDTVDHTSTPSTNMAPNPHGTYSATVSTNSCIRCHSVHGGGLSSPKLGARSASACYKCHGATPATSAYGAASTMDTQGRFNDDSAIAGGGSGAEGGTGNDGWTIHRTDDMSGSSFGRECDACHSPHRKAYDDTPALSYGRMLRMYSTQGDAGSAPTYSTDAAPFGEKMCYECHGTGALGVMDSFGGVGTYAATAGDHQAVYETTGTNGAAHSPGNVRYSTRAARPNGGNLPKIACLACHNKHASPARGLADYRSSDTTLTTYDQQGLCFACHSVTSAEGVQSTGTAPFSWNRRDVKAQFMTIGGSDSGSRHPLLAGKGRYVDRSGAVFAQSTKSQFDANGAGSFFQTTSNTADGDGSVVLTQYIPTIDPPAETYLFAYDGGSQTFDQYRPADDAWNANNYGKFVPPNGSFSTGSGSTVFSAGGNVYVTRSGSTTLPMIRQYTPPANSGAGTWASTALTTTFNSQFGVGSQSAVNSASSVAYISAGGGSNIIDWWNYPNNTENNMTFSGGNLAAGSAMAYAPTSDRLFVLYRNGSTSTGGSVGRLFWLAAPGVRTGAQTFTDGGSSLQLTRNTANTDYNRLVHFRDGAGVDYLMMTGLDTTGANDTIIVSSLGAATPAKTELNLSPFAAALADGCDLKWDGVSGGYVYATRGGANSAMARIRIPAANAQTAGNWGAWTALSNTPQAQDAGAGIAFATADPPSYIGSSVYHLTGTLTTSDIRVSAGTVQSWGTLTFSRSLPNGSTSANVKVQGWNGSAWVDLATATSSPYDLSGISAATYQKLRLVGLLTTTDQSVTPRIDSWSVTANWREWVSGTDVDTEWPSFSQATKAELDSNGAGSFYQTVSNVDDGDGSVVLGTFSGANPMPVANYWFYVDSPVRADSLAVGGAAWNADFDPTDPGTAPGAGASVVTKNGYLFALRGGGTTIDTYLPPANSGTGTWGTTATGAWQTIGTGSDLCLDTTDGYIWALAANGTTPSNADGGTNIRRTTAFATNALAWYNTTGYDGPAFRTSASGDRALSNGAALAWTPANSSRPERLWVVNRNNTSTRDGLLYYYNNPDNATGGTNWNATSLQIGRNDTTADTGTRMAYFRIGSTDYLYALRGLANLAYLAQLPTTDVATLTMIENGTATNPFGGNIGDGCDLQWNGDTTAAGFRMFAIRGGNSTASAVGTWDGTKIVWAAGPVLGNAASSGSYLGYASADPAPKVTSQYYATGTLTSISIAPTSTAVRWGAVTYEPFLPSAQTNVEVSVEGFDGASWSTLVPATSANPIDLTSYWTEDFPQVRLVARLTTADPAQTPRLDSWSATSVYLRFQTAGSVTCVNCHNVHRVKTAGASYWQLGRISDPDDINLTPTDTTTFCLRCHDGAPPVATRSATVNVPYSVSYSSVDAAISPLFPGWSKAASGMAFTSSGHYTATVANGKALCENCHDPHASTFDRLLAWTRPTGVTWTGTAPAAVSRGNTSTADAFEENLCYKCHGSGTAPTGKAAGAINVFTPAGLTYKHPIATNGTTVRHSDLEGPAELGATNRHSECADCHNPHAAKPGIHAVGSSTAGEVLRGSIGIKPTWSGTQWTTFTGVAPQTILPGAGDDYEAYLCIKCHSKYSGQPYSVTTGSGTYTSTDLAVEFNPANDSGHNVFGPLTNWPKEAVGSFQSAPANSMTWPTNATFQAGWSKTSKVTCSDCHTYSAGNARGPHGSTVRMLIDSAYPTAWQSAQLGSTTVICAKCHGNVRGMNDGHVSDHSGSDGRCIACHVKIPHGWKRPRLLGYTTDPEPYRSLNLTGITLKNYSGGNWSESDCGQTGCGEHSSNPSGTKWP